MGVTDNIDKCQTPHLQSRHLTHYQTRPLCSEYVYYKMIILFVDLKKNLSHKVTMIVNSNYIIRFLLEAAFHKKFSQYQVKPNNLNNCEQQKVMLHLL